MSEITERGWLSEQIKESQRSLDSLPSWKRDNSNSRTAHSTAKSPDRGLNKKK